MEKLESSVMNSEAKSETAHFVEIILKATTRSHEG